MHTIVQSELLNFNSAKVKLSFTYLTNIYWAPVLSAENRATNNAHEGPALVESATQCISIFPFFICFDKAKWTLTEPKFTDNYFNAKHCSEHRGYSAKTGSLPSRRLRCWIKWMYSFLPTQRWILKGQPNQTFIKQTDEGGKKKTHKDMPGRGKNHKGFKEQRHFEKCKNLHMSRVILGRSQQTIAPGPNLAHHLFL